MLTTYKKLQSNKSTCFDCNGTTLRESIVRGETHVQKCSTCKGRGELEKGVYIHQNIKNQILIGYFNVQTNQSIVGLVVLSPTFSSMSLGYRYDKWTDIDFVAPIDAFLTHEGYMNFIEHASYEQLSNFFKVKDAVSKAIAVDSRLLIASKFYDLVQNKKGDDSVFNYFFS
jgi:hypothetical protein